MVEEHLFEHRPEEPYDAMVVLGVTEHLTDYPATLREFQRVLKPGGRVYLDATGSRRKWAMSTFARAHVWPGGGTPMRVSSYLRAVERSVFDLVEVRSDRHNYALTTRRWAENLDRTGTGSSNGGASARTACSGSTSGARRRRWPGEPWRRTGW